MAGKEVGIIGLGKMGKNIALNMLRKGYFVHAYNRSPEPADEVASKGAKKSASIKELVKGMKSPRIIWVMVTAGDATISAVTELALLCSKGDVVIDGSNSFYKESLMLQKELAKKGIDYLDAGCSGGPSGALSGMSIMVGGDKGAFAKAEKLFKDLSVPSGYLYVGKVGSGHFTKMVHNAIEYGMMQAIGEGLELLEEGPYEDVDLAAVCRLWNNGSVIRGYLMELAARALEKDGDLSEVSPYVEDTGEGRWAVKEAIDHDVPFNAITNSLYERFESRSKRKFSKRVLAALRHEFGGHSIKKE